MIQKKINLCFLITSLNTGGAEMMLYRLLSKINQNKYEPSVISLLPSGPIAEKISCLGIPVYSLNVSAKSDIWAFGRLIKLLKELSPDILHTHCYHANLLGRIAGRALHIPVVISSIRTTIFGGLVRELSMRWTDPLATVTTTICKAAAERMIERGVVNQNRVKVIYNGIDSDIYSLQGVSNRDLAKKKYGFQNHIPLLLNVGGLRKPKGHIILLEAAAILKKKGISFSLVIAGEGKLRPDLERAIEKLRLVSNVCLLGQRDDIPELMSAADIFVLSSLWEGLPGVVLEAMASGLPVVSTNVGGVSELVVENETGFLVPPKNPQLLAEAIERMLLLPENQRLAMGLAGKKRVEDNFTLDKMVSAYEELYFKCMEEKGFSKMEECRLCQ